MSTVDRLKNKYYTKMGVFGNRFCVQVLSLGGQDFEKKDHRHGFDNDRGGFGIFFTGFCRQSRVFVAERDKRDAYRRMVRGK